MSRLVQILVPGIELPNGQQYATAGQQVIITDDQFSQIATKTITTNSTLTPAQALAAGTWVCDLGQVNTTALQAQSTALSGLTPLAMNGYICESALQEDSNPAGYTTPVDESIYLAKVVPTYSATTSFGTIYLGAAVGLTLTSAYLVLYGLSGSNLTQLAITASQIGTGQFGNSGATANAAYKVAWTTPYSLVGNTAYYAGLWVHGTTTSLKVAGVGQNANAALLNAGYTGAPYRFNSYATGVTAPPATIALSNLVSEAASAVAPWIALS